MVELINFIFFIVSYESGGYILIIGFIMFIECIIELLSSMVLIMFFFVDGEFGI